MSLPFCGGGGAGRRRHASRGGKGLLCACPYFSKILPLSWTCRCSCARSTQSRANHLCTRGVKYRNQSFRNVKWRRGKGVVPSRTGRCCTLNARKSARVKNTRRTLFLCASPYVCLRDPAVAAVQRRRWNRRRERDCVNARMGRAFKTLPLPALHVLPHAFSRSPLQPSSLYRHTAFVRLRLPFLHPSPSAFSLSLPLPMWLWLL